MIVATCWACGARGRELAQEVCLRSWGGQHQVEAQTVVIGKAKPGWTLPANYRSR